MPGLRLGTDQIAALKLGAADVTAIYVGAAQLWPGGLLAAPGAFALTGQDAALRRSLLFSAAAGSFTLSGQDVDLLRVLDVTAGSFAFTGQAAGLYRNAMLTADAGSFTMTGQDADLVPGGVLDAAAGSFVLTGQDAALLRAYLVGAEAGVFTATGQAAGLLRALRLAADVGAFALTGQDASLTYDAGGFSCTMTAATISGVGVGYSDGTLATAGGSIDQEPVPGETMIVCGDDGANTGVYFAGDLTATLNGLSVWVDSVDYTSAFGTTWTFSGGSTFITTSDGGRPTFTASTSYLIQIK